MSRPIRARLDWSALRHNHSVVRHHADAAHVWSVVKADAYGVGMERVVRTLGPMGPWGFGVATTREGRDLRRMGWDGPVIVFAPSRSRTRATNGSRPFLCSM